MVQIINPRPPALQQRTTNLTWILDFNTNGEVRVYTVYGKESLEDAKWTTPTNSAHRFFKVGVEMP